jgi:hypothetical protein
MQPKRNQLEDCVTALVFPSLIAMTDYLGTVPDFFKELESGIWSDVKKPNPTDSTEIWLMINSNDLKKIEHLL